MKIKLPAAVVLLLFSSIFFIVVVSISSWGYYCQFKGDCLVNISRYLNNLIDKKRSYTEISLAQERGVSFKFFIDKDDEQELTRLLEKAEIGESWKEGVFIGLDEESVERLKRYLPLRLTVWIEQDVIKFSSGGRTVSLNTGQSGEVVEMATGSAKARLDVRGEQDFKIEIIKPKRILEYATESGKLQISAQVYPMFPKLEKIDRMNVTVKNHNIEGEIVFKF